MYVIDHTVAFAIDAPAKASHLQQIDQNIDELDGRFHPSTGHTHNGTDSPYLASFTGLLAGDWVMGNNNATARTTSSLTTPVLAKQSRVNRGGTLRISFDLGHNVNTFTVGARVYRNGVAVGTLRTEGTGATVNYSEDIAGWSADDLVQVYAYRTDNSNPVVSNLTVTANKPLVVVYDPNAY